MGGGPEGAPPAGARRGARRGRRPHLLARPLSALAPASRRFAGGGRKGGGDVGQEEVGEPARDAAPQHDKARREAGERGAGEGWGAGGGGAPAPRGPPPDGSRAAAAGGGPAPGRTDYRPPLEDSLGRGRVLAAREPAPDDRLRRRRPTEGEIKRYGAALSSPSSLRPLPRPQFLVLRRFLEQCRIEVGRGAGATPSGHAALGLSSRRVRRSKAKAARAARSNAYAAGTARPALRAARTVVTHPARGPRRGGRLPSAKPPPFHQLPAPAPAPAKRPPAPRPARPAPPRPAAREPPRRGAQQGPENAPPRRRPRPAPVPRPVPVPRVEAPEPRPREWRVARSRSRSLGPPPLLSSERARAAPEGPRGAGARGGMAAEGGLGWRTGRSDAAAGGAGGSGGGGGAAGRAAGRKLAAFSGAMWAVPAGLFALTKVAPEADFVKLGAAAVVVVNAVRARSPAPLLPGRPSRALPAPQRPWAPSGGPADAGVPPACTPVPRSSSCTSARPGGRSPGSGRARPHRRGRRRTSACLRRPAPPPRERQIFVCTRPPCNVDYSLEGLRRASGSGRRRARRCSRRTRGAGRCAPCGPPL